MQFTTALCVSGLVFLTIGSGALRADSISQTYSGSLTDPSAVVQQAFTLSSASDVQITTTSYGGGTNADGSSTPAGGFQPNVTLYTSGGSYVTSQQAGSPVAAADPVTNLALDAYLSNNALAAGSYIITLTDWDTQQSPTATNLSDGFIRYGGTSFADVSGATRTADYSLNLTAGGAPAGAPEPATMGVTAVAAGLALAVMRYRRRKG